MGCWNTGHLYIALHLLSLCLEYDFESFHSRTPSTLRSNALCHTPNTKTNNISLRIFTRVLKRHKGHSLSLSSSIDFEGSYSCTRSTLRSHTLRQSVNPPDSFYPTDLVAVHFLVVVVVNDFGLWSIDHEVTCKWLNDC